MAKGNYNGMTYWQEMEAIETRQKKTDKRLNYLLIASFTGMIIVAFCELF